MKRKYTYQVHDFLYICRFTSLAEKRRFDARSEVAGGVDSLHLFQLFVAFLCLRLRQTRIQARERANARTYRYSVVILQPKKNSRARKQQPPFFGKPPGVRRARCGHAKHEHHTAYQHTRYTHTRQNRNRVVALRNCRRRRPTTPAWERLHYRQCHMGTRNPQNRFRLLPKIGLWSYDYGYVHQRVSPAPLPPDNNYFCGSAIQASTSDHEARYGGGEKLDGTTTDLPALQQQQALVEATRLQLSGQETLLRLLRHR